MRTNYWHFAALEKKSDQMQEIPVSEATKTEALQILIHS